MDARLQNESVDASDEHDASRESPERSSSSCRRIPAGTLRDGSNVGTGAGFFSSAAAAAASLPGLGDAFRPRVADTDLVLLPADLGSESPPPDAGDSRPLALDPDIATESLNFSPKPPSSSSAPWQALSSRKHQIDEALLGEHQTTRKRAPGRGQPAAFQRIPGSPSLSPRKSASKTLAIGAQPPRHCGQRARRPRSRPRKRRNLPAASSRRRTRSSAAEPRPRPARPDSGSFPCSAEPCLGDPRRRRRGGRAAGEEP